MHPVIAKTFGGLSAPYYFRHLLFGSFFLLPPLFMIIKGGLSFGFPLLILLAAIGNTLLYPYSRYVYESVMNFLIGDNMFLINPFIFLLFKMMTMMLCWWLAVFIAPFGLGYLYYHHSKPAH
jgi:hypothetical protein